MPSSRDERPSELPQAKIVTFAPCIPFPGIGHAGGGLFQSYVEQTGDIGERLLVIPDRYDDGSHVAESDVPAVHIVTETRGIGTRLCDKLATYALPEATAPGVVRVLSHDGLVVSRLRSADIVEYHWHHLATLLPWARRHAPQARHVVLLYDVVSQRIARERSSATGLHAKQLIYNQFVARAQEIMISRLADAIIVLSNKDAQLLPRRSKVVVAHPVVRVPQSPAARHAVPAPAAQALPAQQAPSAQEARPAESTPGDASQRHRPPVFIFVGAFLREENLEGAEWLCREIWPLIRQRLPEAELRLAGDDPLGSLEPLVSDTPGAVRTGYVDDLALEYANADVALIPLLHGAGVKLKTVEAILTGTPAVSTTVGAEGIDRASEFLSVTDSSQKFADEAVRLATDTTGQIHERAAAGSHWAADTHGPEQFRASLLRALVPEQAA